MEKGGFTIGRFITIFIIVVLLNILFAPIIKKYLADNKTKTYDIKRNEILVSYQNCISENKERCSSVKFLIQNKYVKTKCKKKCIKNPLTNEYLDDCYVTNGDIHCDKAKNAVKTLISLSKSKSKNNSCVEDLHYDKTKDNNLRYTGANPCNYVSFNGDVPKLVTKYKLIDEKGMPSSKYWYDFDSFAECNKAYNSNLEYHKKNGYSCMEKNVTSGGWRIIGVMNNIDNGKGKLESRIKLIKNEPIGYYSYNSNDWSKSSLMKELNDDYLNNNLNSNTNWYNGKNKTAVYDYTSSLNNESQVLINNAKWYLNKLNQTKISSIYNEERENKTWTGKVGLMYISDYVYATGSIENKKCLSKSFNEYISNKCDKYNYLFLSKTQWFINPSLENKVYVKKIDSIASKDSNLVYAVRPTVYLKPNTLIISGDGSLSSPFLLGI